MKINRCDCCGTETKDFIVIRFGADGFFYPAPTSEVCSKCIGVKNNNLIDVYKCLKG